MSDDSEVHQCEACEGKGADFYGTCWTCGGTGFVDADGFMAQEPLPDAPARREP